MSAFSSSPAKAGNIIHAGYRMDAPEEAAASLRILHVMRAPIGGLFRHVLDLAGEQSRRGHAVGIVADASTADGLTLARLRGIEPRLRLGVQLVPMSRQPGFSDLAASRHVYRLAKALRADILHGHGAKGGAYARLAAMPIAMRGGNVKAFYTPHGGSLHFKPGTFGGGVVLGIEKMLGRITDGLIFESDFARRAYVERVGAGTIPMRVIPNGLNPIDFTPHAPLPNAADFLYIGELRDIKGVDILLRALSKLNVYKPVTAVIVGSGPDEERLKALAEYLRLGSRVRFPGTMPARDALPLGRCLVVPSLAESFPYVVLEAGAAGMPLVATNVGGIPEIVAGTHIRLIPPGDIPALTAMMHRVREKPESARLDAKELRSAVQRKFTVEAMTDEVLAFYASPATVVAPRQTEAVAEG
jgi:glycosyltransferase involved in cell wall biosynthesis